MLKQIEEIAAPVRSVLPPIEAQPSIAWWEPVTQVALPGMIGAALGRWLRGKPTRPRDDSNR